MRCEGHTSELQSGVLAGPGKELQDLARCTTEFHSLSLMEKEMKKGSFINGEECRFLAP